jgi:hypothetical protein
MDLSSLPNFDVATEKYLLPKNSVVHIPHEDLATIEETHRLRLGRRWPMWM